MVNEHIAHGSLTNSKHPRSFVEGVYPTTAKKGSKCYLFDVDDNRYIDFICALGTNLFGYGNHAILESVNSAMSSGGSVFSLSSDKELELAERLKGTFPWLERMRFLKTGSEGCSAAVRIARAYTGKPVILSEGYHGWNDGFVSLTEPAHGVFGDFSFEKYSEDADFNLVAAVIIEPVMLDFSAARIDWLNNLRNKCIKHGTLLIFDETITAYRFKDGSVARATGIYPDLWIGGKALAGGLPISVVGGRKEVMESEYFISSTWAGDRLAIEAAKTANNLIHDDKFRPNTLWSFGTEFLAKFNALSPHIKIDGYATRGSFVAKPIYKALFWQECVKAGVLFGPSWFYNIFLHEEMDNVLSICKNVLDRIEDGKVSLEGSMPLSPFSQQVREAL